MKEIVLITGANGFVAKRLSQILLPRFHVRYLSRSPKNEDEFHWDLQKQIIDVHALVGVDHIIHLAGADISEKRWTHDRKNEIISSRVQSARLLLKTLSQNKIYIKSFISASAVGYYGSNSDNSGFTEEALKGEGFLANVVDEWEKAADQFLLEKVAERVVKIRTGVILAKEKGALPKMTLPIKYGIGSPLGTGTQYLSWIHIDDICQIYQLVLERSDLQGVFNGVSPNPVTNKELTKEIARKIKRPILFPSIPSWILKIVFGEMSSVLLDNIKVSSQKIEKAGFKFQFSNIKEALENLLQ
jgi:uncharacterized protein (TIGR01777 family)